MELFYAVFKAAWQLMNKPFTMYGFEFTFFGFTLLGIIVAGLFKIFDAIFGGDD